MLYTVIQFMNGGDHMYGIIEVLCWVWVVIVINRQSELIEILERRSRKEEWYEPIED